MLAIYTLVFSQIFRARWGESLVTGHGYYAANLFTGLIIFNIFSECIAKAPTLILQNPNLIKKVVFPIEVLGIAQVSGTIVNALSSCIVLILMIAIRSGELPYMSMMLPATIVPLGLMCLGVTWLLSIGCVFFRDINQLVSAFISAMMFLSPVFYPISAMPGNIRWLGYMNPIGVFIKDTRQILVEGSMPSPWGVILMWIITPGASHAIEL